MHKRHAAVWLVTLVLGASAVHAADKKKASAEMDASMAQMMKNSSPGVNHQVLDAFAGNWTYTSKMWMKPGDKAQESNGTSYFAWVLGGRFLKQEVKGNFNGQPFEGLGYVGYDNIRQEYQTIWMDNVATGIAKGAGTYNAATKTITENGEMSCPMTGEKSMGYRAEWKVVDKDTAMYSSYTKDASGKEFKGMELTYKRVK